MNSYHQTLAAYLFERNPTWMDDAGCTGADPELWFPLGGPGNEAKRICRDCPVTTECADYAIRTRQDDGIWGGLNPDERRTITNRRPKRKPA